MKVAALDLGSNTFLCLLAEVEGRNILKIIEDHVEIVRLGQDVQKNKFFHPDALLRADNCLRKFSEIIKKYKPDVVLAMATSAARDAQNGEELFKIGAKYQIPIEIIPGQKEAQITFDGSTSGLKKLNKNVLVVDIGGGSTEIILGNEKQILFAQSIDIGCVRMMEVYLKKQPADKEQLIKMEKYIDDQLMTVINKIDQKDLSHILAVAGTPTELARIELGYYDAQKIDGMNLSAEYLKNKYDQFSNSDVLTIQNTYKVSLGRADVITVGVYILKRICELLNQDGISVSTRGVRFGVALEAARRKKQ